MINGTVLGVAPIKTSLLVIGGVISVFCTLIKPEVSAGLSLLPRFAFWVSHVGMGLLGILLASLILSRCRPHRQLSLFVTIGLTGMLGTLLATPGLLLLEEFFPEEIDPEWLDIFGQRGWWQALLAEYLQVLPKLLPIWYLVNLPLLFNKPVLHQLPESAGPGVIAPRLSFVGPAAVANRPASLPVVMRLRCPRESEWKFPRRHPRRREAT